MYSDIPNQPFPMYNHGLLNVLSPSWLSLVLISSIFLLFSCKKTTTVQQESLYGKWDIHKAMRNGTETPYLRGGFFIIEPTGSMTINITGTEERGTYVIDGNTMRHNNEKDFIIESMKQDSMAIRYDMNTENTFLFYLTKKMNEVR